MDRPPPVPGLPAPSSCMDSRPSLKIPLKILGSSATSLHDLPSGESTSFGMSSSPDRPLLLLIVLTTFVLGLWGAQQWKRGCWVQPRMSQPPTRSLVLLRRICAANVLLTMAWSYFSLSHVHICDDTGARCLRFAGTVQLSTFTRWSWMLQGVYFLSVSFGWRGSELLFGVSLASALLVTAVTYSVLVPGMPCLPSRCPSPYP